MNSCFQSFILSSKVVEMAFYVIFCREKVYLRIYGREFSREWDPVQHHEKWCKLVRMSKDRNEIEEKISIKDCLEERELEFVCRLILKGEDQIGVTMIFPNREQICSPQIKILYL